MTLSLSADNVGTCDTRPDIVGHQCRPTMLADNDGLCVAGFSLDKQRYKQVKDIEIRNINIRVSVTVTLDCKYNIIV